MKSWLNEVIKQYKVHPTSVIFIEGENEITYQDFILDIFTLARDLKKIINKGSYIIIKANRNYKSFVLYGACILNKYIYVPLDENAKDTQIDSIKNILPNSIYIEDINLVYPSEESRISKLPLFVPINKNNVSQILFTTGTTGVSKGVVSTNKFFTNLLTPREGFTKETRIVISTPINHFGAIYLTLSTIVNGGSVILLKSAMDFDELFISYEKRGANTFFATPSILKMWIKVAGTYFSSLPLNNGYVGGEYCSPQLFKSFNELTKKELISFYGSTETGLVSINKNDLKSNSIGKVFNGKTVSIFNGLINVKSSYLMKSYLDEEPIKGQITMSDLGHSEGDTLFFDGRNDSSIICGGLNIDPKEIESIVNENEKVIESICIGKDDEIFNQIPVLYYVGDIEVNILKKLLSKSLEQNKIPKRIIKVESLKKTNTGKIDIKYYKELI